jgi:capsular polysaccharide biosynthesis protein
MGNNSDNNDEIDVRIIYQSIKGFFSGISNFILNIFHVAKRRWLLISICTLIGIAGGIKLFFISPPVYISSLTLSSSILSNDFCSDIVTELGLIVEDNTPALLAKKLNISVSSASQIKKIEFANYNDKLKKKYEDKDSIVLGLPFKIKVYAYSNTVFDTLQKAFVNYLEKNEYASKRKEIRKEENRQMQAKLKEQIYGLDSLKTIVSNNLVPRGNPSGFVFGQPIDPVNIYKEGIIFFQKELDLNKEMELIDNIQVISDFSARDKPDSPRLWKTTAAGGSAGLLLGLLIASMLESRKKRKA